MSRESLRLVQSNIAKCRAENETETLLGDAVQLIDRLYKKACALILFLPTRRTTKGWCRRLSPRLHKARC